MTIQLGDTAPNFTANTTEGTVSLHEYLGDSWGILFSHLADFTPVGGLDGVGVDHAVQVGHGAVPRRRPADS